MCKPCQLTLPQINLCTCWNCHMKFAHCYRQTSYTSPIHWNLQTCNSSLGRKIRDEKPKLMMEWCSLFQTCKGILSLPKWPKISELNKNQISKTKPLQICNSKTIRMCNSASKYFRSATGTLPLQAEKSQTNALTPQAENSEFIHSSSHTTKIRPATLLNWLEFQSQNLSLHTQTNGR